MDFSMQIDPWVSIDIHGDTHGSTVNKIKQILYIIISD